MLVQALAIAGALVGTAGIVAGASGCSAATFGRCGPHVRSSPQAGAPAARA